MFALRSSSRLLLLQRVPLARQLCQTSVRRNAVQELYLRELRNAKLSPVTAKDAEGNVKPWVNPVKPQQPALEGQGADALKAYADEAVETKSSVVEEEDAVEEDWLVLEDAPEDAHGH